MVAQVTTKYAVAPAGILSRVVIGVVDVLVTVVVVTVAGGPIPRVGLGLAVGESVKEAAGLEVGLLLVGLCVGDAVGLAVGDIVGDAVVGLAVGLEVGLPLVGRLCVGVAVGLAVGLCVGDTVGLAVGDIVGGAVVGLAVGLEVGLLLIVGTVLRVVHKNPLHPCVKFDESASATLSAAASEPALFAIGQYRSCACDQCQLYFDHSRPPSWFCDTIQRPALL